MGAPGNSLYNPFTDPYSRFYTGPSGAPPLAAQAVATFVPVPRPGGVAGLCGFDWGQIQYAEFSSDDPVVGLQASSGASLGSSPVVFSKPPRPGHFWMILGLSWSAVAAPVHAFGVFLVPPAAAGPSLMQFFFKDGVTGDFRAIPKTGVLLRGGIEALSGNSGQSGGREHSGEFTPALIIVPPGWALMVAKDKAQNGVGIADTLLLQLAYAELPIGSDSPGFGG